MLNTGLRAGVGTPGGFSHNDALAVAGAPLEVGAAAASRAAVAAKRALDVAASLLALLLMLPLVPLVMLAIRLSSPGPVLYVAERIGRHGHPFRMLKFRSMYADAERRKLDWAAWNEASGPVFKIRRDPRVTPVGRLLRKLSIDELPQLVNVLRGDMSLVGPRPPLPDEVTSYGPREWQRLRVRPGLTCIWQVSGRSLIDFDHWIEMDLEYIRTWSLWLDLRLLARTIPAVLSSRGAY